MIDYITDFPLLTSSQPQGAYAPARQPALAALVTHLHEDHTDIDAIASAVGPNGLVLRPLRPLAVAGGRPLTEPAEQRLAATSMTAREVTEWERIDIAPFLVTAVPAVDGLGDPQVNWVVEADGQRFFHGGDTIFHGYWWLIAERVGPIDVAVMPINGAIVQAPHLRPPSSVPAVMTPEQAVEAAVILGAGTLIPIHFGVHQPPIYVEQSDSLGRLASAARGRPLRIATPAAGEELRFARGGGTLRGT
ncbi:MBL fold metallo-hydrolase [Mycolicibacterium goodii]|uniref:MBL fold metallo-hydrolase n=1 Tax=Mycolicibacterium goodii TaxID=134601 RepID=UPI00296F6EED